MADLKRHRWRNIFQPDGKTVIFAMDHAAAFGMMEHLEHPGETIRKVREGGADAILTTFGVCSQFMEEIGNMGIILRCDGGGSRFAREPGPMKLIYDVYDALRIGADAVGVMGMPGSQYESETLPYLSELVSQATEWNMPVMAETLPAGFENPAQWWTPENIGHACRIGAELGVDFVKTEYTGDIESFRRIVDQVYVPIVVLGGSKSPDPRDLLTKIHDAMQAGARGVAVGRNISQHPAPDRMTAAIVAIVHKNASVDDAVKLLT